MMCERGWKHMHTLKTHTFTQRSSTHTHLWEWTQAGTRTWSADTPTYILYMHTQPMRHSKQQWTWKALCGCPGDRERCIDLEGAVIKRSWSLIRILITLRHGYANDNNTTKHSSSHQYLCMLYSLMSLQRWQAAKRIIWECLMCNGTHFKRTLELVLEQIYPVSSSLQSCKLTTRQQIQII